MVQSRRHRGNHVASEIVADPELTQSDAHRLVKRPVGKFRNTDADHIVFGDGSIENKPAQHGPRYDDHGGGSWLYCPIAHGPITARSGRCSYPAPAVAGVTGIG